jgi:hypothetical protein
MLSTASLVLFVLSALLTFAGLPCCLGCLNWFAVPLSMVTVFVGFVGLLADRDPHTRAMRSVGVHLLAMVGGAALVLVGALRCALGCGVASAALPNGHGIPPIWHCDTDVASIEEMAVFDLDRAASPVSGPR